MSELSCLWVYSLFSPSGQCSADARVGTQQQQRVPVSRAAQPRKQRKAENWDAKARENGQQRMKIIEIESKNSQNGKNVSQNW